jgi:4'-phosphopantetheinyl transferase
LNERIPERFFAPREVAALRALPRERQPQGFFNCWTRKEAFIKAKGLGLSLPLDSFEVSLAPGEPAALLCTRPDPQEAMRWSMRALSPDPAFAAALVVESDGWRLQCWEWSF